MPTHLVILASANLYREAWRALLSGQPDISVVATIADVSAAASLPLVDHSQPITILIDLPAPPPDLARQLRECFLNQSTASLSIRRMLAR